MFVTTKLQQGHGTEPDRSLSSHLHEAAHAPRHHSRRLEAGVDFRATSAIGIRIAELGYSHSWHSQFEGIDYSNAVEMTMGLTLRWGTW